jgi:hypothetical protein
MADGLKLDKVKEQYVDAVVSILPFAQALFIVLIVMVSDQFSEKGANSLLHALSNVGFKSALGPGAGRFWDVGFTGIAISFLLALVNLYIIRFALEYSIQKADLSRAINTWQSSAARSLQSLNDAQKGAIKDSFRLEIDLRLKRYRTRRIAAEVVASLTAVGVYATFFLVWQGFRSGFSLEFSWPDAIFIATSLFSSFILHRGSLRYAIKKILPLKVYLAVLTGEIVFFEDLTS